MKRVLFFGIYNPKYARTRVLTEGFTELGYEIVSCRVDPRTYPGIRKYIQLWRLGKKYRSEKFDYVFVLFPGHTVVWLARMLFGNRIIFDMFVSLFDSNVHDRAVYTPHSLHATYDRFLDWFSCALAHKVLADTNVHKHYFIEQIGVHSKKLIVVPVGTSMSWFVAGDKTQVQEITTNPLLVVFYGSFIPLHGVPVIVRAAQDLADDNVQFRIIGNGQEYEATQLLVKKLGGVPNIEFISSMSRDELIKNVYEADVTLGIFGSTEKASRVIPNKVYECAALGKPIITANTPAIREVFTDKENIFLVTPVSAHALACAVRSITADTELQKLLASGARCLMQKSYTPELIVGELVKILSR